MPRPSASLPMGDSTSGSSEFALKVDRVLKDVPPYGSELRSNVDGKLFAAMTGVTQSDLTKAWAKGKNLTTCNSFTGWFARQMGSRSYLGRFDLQTFAARAWVPSDGESLPPYGAILRFKTFHVGVALDFCGDYLNTVESGQGGPKAGCDILKRKQTLWTPDKFLGWVDLEAWISGQ